MSNKDYIELEQEFELDDVTNIKDSGQNAGTARGGGVSIPRNHLLSVLGSNNGFPLSSSADVRNGKHLSSRIRNSNSEGRRFKQPRFGICFDIDGVLARGTTPITAAQEGFKKLLDFHNRLKFPVAFVTNALNTNQDKANQLSSWFDVTITKDQMIQSPSPLEVFEQYHNKRCLAVGQGKILEICQELGFQNLCTIEEVAQARPLLDVVNHDNRKIISKNDLQNRPREPIKPIEVILLMGEPKHWESALQIITDLLVTHGYPDRDPEVQPDRHIPVIACNLDLRFMERCHMPRFGHGAFLVCLEALYKTITGKELAYTSLMGKPSEITYRFAEHVLTREARGLGYNDPLRTMYFIGDNQESDIVGSNLYQRYIDRMRHRRRRISVTSHESRDDPDLPDSRNVPAGTDFFPQTIETVESILVCTGVYKRDKAEVKEEERGDERRKLHHGHRDFPKIAELHLPTLICEDVSEAIDYILAREGAN